MENSKKEIEQELHSRVVSFFKDIEKRDGVSCQAPYTLLLAVSGGVDSMSLLDVFCNEVNKEIYSPWIRVVGVVQ